MSTLALGLLCILLLVAGCGQSAPAPVFALEDAFPSADAIPGWTPDGDVATYDSETLFDLVNGQADAFFAYNFESVAVRSYVGEDNVVRVEIWQLATPTDAYGLFTRNRTGESADVGNAGDTDPGRRIAFWQDRYYVQVRARQSLDAATLRAFADTVASALHTGGEVPALVERLPQDGLVTRSEVFFRQELSIQDEVWLGGENILGLTDETKGALARYDLVGDIVYLLLVQYSDVQAAETALMVLTTSDVADVVLVDVNESTLGAIFGSVEPETVRQLLDTALE